MAVGQTLRSPFVYFFRLFEGFLDVKTVKLSIQRLNPCSASDCKAQHLISLRLSHSVELKIAIGTYVVPWHFFFFCAFLFFSPENKKQCFTQRGSILSAFWVIAVGLFYSAAFLLPSSIFLVLCFLHGRYSEA